MTTDAIKLASIACLQLFYGKGSHKSEGGIRVLRSNSVMATLNKGFERYHYSGKLHGKYLVGNVQKGTCRAI